MSKPVRLTRPEIEALIAPPAHEAPPEGIRLAWGISSAVGLPLLFVILIASGIDVYERTGDATELTITVVGILAGLLGVVLGWISEHDRTLRVVERGIRRRVPFGVEIIPWDDLLPAVVTGSTRPFKITFLAKDGLPVGSFCINEDHHRELVLEVLSRIPVRDERTGQSRAPDSA